MTGSAKPESWRHFAEESCCSRSIRGLGCFERCLASVHPCFDRTVDSDPEAVEPKGLVIIDLKIVGGTKDLYYIVCWGFDTY